jgi:hypothetical protein
MSLFADPAGNLRVVNVNVSALADPDRGLRRHAGAVIAA